MQWFLKRFSRRALGLATASTLLALIVGELAVRSLGLDPAPREGSFSTKVHSKAWGTLGEVMGIELRPGASGQVTYPPDRGQPQRSVAYRINSLGFRDRELTAAKSPKEYRILCLGDSFTFGTGIDQSDTWPRLLGEVLGERDRRVTTANLGIYSLNVLQQEAWLRRVLDERDVQASHVVWCFYINDASGLGFERSSKKRSSAAHWIERLGLTSGVWKRGTETSDPMKRTMWLRRRSALADLLAYRLYENLHRQVTVEHYLENWSRDGDSLETVRHSVDRVAALCAKRGLRLSLCMYPALIGRFDDSHPYADAHAVLGEIAKDTGTEYLDLRVPLQGSQPATLWAHLHDQHPNRLANERVAAYLADELFPGPGTRDSAHRE